METVNLQKSDDELGSKFSWLAKCGWPKTIQYAAIVAGGVLITNFITKSGYSAMVTYKKDSQGNVTGTWILASPNPNPNIASLWRNACNADTQKDQHLDEGVSPGSTADFYRATLADLQDELNKSFASVLVE